MAVLFHLSLFRPIASTLITPSVQRFLLYKLYELL